MNGFAARWVGGWLQGLGRISLLILEVVGSLFTRRINGRDLACQLHFVGVKFQSVVLITGAFTGMVLCAQTCFQFHNLNRYGLLYKPKPVK